MSELMGISFSAVMEDGRILLALTALHNEPLEFKRSSFMAMT